MERPWNVEVVADSDSRWKWGAAVAERLAPGREVQLHASLLLGRSTPNDRQLREVGADAASLRQRTVADTVARLSRTDADVVVLACVGGGVQALLQALARAWDGRARRPVVVTGYVGLVYEKTVDGLVNRAGADLVLANCAADAARFAQVYTDLGADPGSVVGTALPFLGGHPHDPHAASRTRPYTLTFVTQPGVPETKRDRRHALGQAAAYARRYPQREVLVKLRARVGERTTHTEPYHYSTLLPADPPPNLSLVYGDMSEVLDRTDLCVTVSSTAAIEAMHRGIPTAVLTDYGIREQLGNHLFLGSGAMTSWPALLRGDVPGCRPEWAAANGVAGGDAAYSAAAHRLADLVAHADGLPPLRPWLSVDSAGAYLPDVLARYGLDPDGRPADRGTGGRNLAARRVLRAGARRAYGYGVRVVEPRIKRLAQL